MLIISQNLTNYEVDIPQDAIFRINLAWVDSIADLESQLKKISSPVFLDLPTGRTKPPNNNYSLDQISGIVKENSNIKYFAVSNVESSSDLSIYLDCFGDSLTLVPKIETKKGIDNIAEITEVLSGKIYLMLDHDDLFRDLQDKGIPPSKFFVIIDKLVDFCDSKSIQLLRMRGVIFSNEDEYFYK